MHYFPFPFWTCDLDAVITVSFNCTYPLFSFSSTYLGFSIVFGWYEWMLFTRFHSNDILSSSSSNNVNVAYHTLGGLEAFQGALSNVDSAHIPCKRRGIDKVLVININYYYFFLCSNEQLIGKGTLTKPSARSLFQISEATYGTPVQVEAN